MLAFFFVFVSNNEFLVTAGHSGRDEGVAYAYGGAAIGGSYDPSSGQEGKTRQRKGRVDRG